MIAPPARFRTGYIPYRDGYIPYRDGYFPMVINLKFYYNSKKGEQNPTNRF